MREAVEVIRGGWVLSRQRAFPVALLLLVLSGCGTMHNADDAASRQGRVASGPAVNSGSGAYDLVLGPSGNGSGSPRPVGQWERVLQARIATQGWTLLSSVALPAAWPIPGPGAAVVRYAYAQRPAPISPTSGYILLEYELSTPFARATEFADGRVEVVTLGPLRVAGRDPLRRMGEWERAWRSLVPESDSRLRAPLDGEGESIVRQAVCGYLGRVPYVRGDVVRYHPEFAAWLRCPYVSLTPDALGAEQATR